MIVLQCFMRTFPRLYPIYYIEYLGMNFRYWSLKRHILFYFLLWSEQGLFILFFKHCTVCRTVINHYFTISIDYLVCFTVLFVRTKKRHVYIFSVAPKWLHMTKKYLFNCNLSLYTCQVWCQDLREFFLEALPSWEDFKMKFTKKTVKNQIFLRILCLQTWANYWITDKTCLFRMNFHVQTIILPNLNSENHEGICQYTNMLRK